MATFTSFGSAFNESENRLAAAKRAAIQRVVADTGISQFGGNLGAGDVSGGQNVSGQNTILADFLQFTGGVRDAQGNIIGSTGVGGGGRPGGGGGFVAPNIVGTPSSPGLSGPSRLLQSSGTVSRQFQTGGGDGGGGRLGDGDGSAQVSRSRTDIQPVLENLLAQLVESGGTPQSQQNSATRMAAATDLLNTIQQLSPQNAEARAIAAVDLVVQRALEEALPQLQAAGESAGTSTNALQALSINDLATRTAGTTAAAILGAITNFAQAQAQAGGALQGITEQDPVSAELIALLTQTPQERESVQGTGDIDLLAALGLTPENLISPQAGTQFITGGPTQTGFGAG